MTRSPRFAGLTSIAAVLTRPGTLRRLAGAILSCEGLLAVNVALGNGAPPFLVGVALIAILTGIGVYRQVDGATVPALLLAGLLILSDITSLPAALADGASMSLPGIVVELLANLFVVYLLLRRPASLGSRPSD